jgi:hypothetical protein
MDEGSKEGFIIQGGVTRRVASSGRYVIYNIFRGVGRVYKGPGKN